MSKDTRSELDRSLDLAVSTLRRGGIVAFPTETCYGLAIDPACTPAVMKLFRVKQRQMDKPLSLLVENIAQLLGIVDDIPDQYLPLIEKYWPGPVTLIFSATEKTTFQILSGNTGTLGIRISSHPIAQALVTNMAKPITATSANMSGLPPARSALEVVDIFGNAVDYILDGGKTSAGLCSTILGIKDNRLSIIRHGQIDASLLLGS